MLRTLFETGSFPAHSAAPLLMELGTAYCLLSKMDVDTQQPLFARLWSFKELSLEESLLKIGSKLQAEGVEMDRLTVSLAFPENFLLPQESHVNSSALIKAIYPGHVGAMHHFSKGKDYVFSVPFGVSQTLEQQFGEVQYVPAFACLPGAGEEVNCIHAFFVDHQFRVAVYKQKKLHLAQQYTFSAPLDVVYYLLKICSEFGLSQQETLLSVSGYIEAGSALYKELHQYFLNIRFGILEMLQIEGQTVPKHYFTSLYNLAACAL